MQVYLLQAYSAFSGLTSVLTEWWQACGLLFLCSFCACLHGGCIVASIMEDALRCETMSSLAVPCREKERAAWEEVDRKEAEREVWFQALPDWKKRLIQQQSTA